ncbi:MAG TPA: alpha-2,3-sialyltransferase [Cytophagaceae bacterium]|jgi:hypothetical protein|nr:alpha-2,3-sialyltransferase [Cytophagaceae bacterium]
MSIHKNANRIKAIERFFQNLYRSLSGILKVLILSKFKITLPKPKGENCIVLGNGPSLKNTFVDYEEILKKTPLVCVNNFATSPEFKEFKPCYYVILDPGFFILKQRPDVIATFNELKNNTNWAVDLFVPYLYRRDPDVEYFQQADSFVKVYFYNYTIAKGFDFLAFKLFSKNLAMPQFYNVLGASVFLAVNMGYKKIWITGADHGWFEEIYVNEDNSLCRKDLHFYDKGEQSLTPIIDPVSGKTQKAGDFFQALHRIFDSYYLLDKYSASRKCKIYNASGFSYIDAFERKKIEL